MKHIWLLVLLFSSLLYSQTLVQTVNLPSGSVWNSAYGLVYANGKYWVSSSSSSGGTKKIFGLDASGNLTDEITINYYTITESQGLAHDGSNFWYVDDKAHNLYKVSSAGVVLDSIINTTLHTGSYWYLGGAAWDGTGIWVSAYYPNANSGIYKIDPVTKQFVDTLLLPAGQLQPTGLTVKGDTLYCVNDGFEGTDKIYAYSITTGEMLYSFDPPEKPGVRQNPRGLAWDSQFFWLMAEPVGASSGRQLFKYNLAGNGTPGITVINPILNFGNVQIDSSLVLNAAIENYGTAELIVSSITSTSSEFTVLNLLPVKVQPGQTENLQIKFTPVANVTQSDTIKLYHNFVAFPYSKINVSGKGVYTTSYISFLPADISFGEKRVNSTSYIEVTIRNLGSQLLTVDSLKLGTPHYNIEGFTGPAVIDTASPTTFKVWFKPTAVQSYPDNLTVYSNAGNGNVKVLPVTANSVTFQAVLGNILWQGNIPPNPMTTSNDYSIKVIKKIQDINNDGIEDVVVATDNYWVIAYNGNSSNSGDILWKFNCYISSSNAGPVEMVQNMQMADVNSDGMQDVIIGTWGGNESVYALNGKTGEAMWEFGLPATYSDGDIMGIDVKRDWNSDGVNDVLVSASGNESTGQGRFSVYLVNGTNGQMIWQIDQSAQQKLKYDVTSTTNGGAFGTRVGTSYEVVGFNKTGGVLWSFSPSGTPYRLGEIQNIGGDANTDIIAGTTTGNVYAISSDAGIQIWTANIGNVFIEDLRVIPDVNGNGVQDILVSGLSSYLHTLEGATGQVIWSSLAGNTILGIGELPDMSGDAIFEAGVSTYISNDLSVMNGTTGALIFNYPMTGDPVEMISALGQIDGAGAGEFIAGSRNGKLVAFSAGPLGIIPVEMTSFTASVNGNEVVLNWNTATELNNKGFTVERKTDKTSFEPLSFISGKGTSTEMSSYFFVDKELPFGTYYYRLVQEDFDGTKSYSKEIEAEVGLPVQYSLDQNYPNPFNPSTVIQYALPYAGSVKLKVYSSVGEEIVTLVNQVQEAGNYKIEWNGRNSHNVKVPTGVYIYRIETDKFTSSKKMLMLK